MKSVEDATRDLLIIIKHIRFAVEQASKNGTVKFAIISEYERGGKIECRFDPDFIEDVALIVGAPEMTDDCRMEANAQKIRDLVERAHR